MVEDEGRRTPRSGPSRAAIIAASCASAACGWKASGKLRNCTRTVVGYRCIDLFDDVERRPADRALEVGEQLERHRCVCRSFAHDAVADLREGSRAPLFADDQFLELRERSGAGIHLAVDGVARRAADARSCSLGDVGGDRPA